MINSMQTHLNGIRDQDSSISKERSNCIEARSSHTDAVKVSCVESKFQLVYLSFLLQGKKKKKKKKYIDLCLSFKYLNPF